MKTFRIAALLSGEEWDTINALANDVVVASIAIPTTWPYAIKMIIHPIINTMVAKELRAGEVVLATPELIKEHFVESVMASFPPDIIDVKLNDCLNALITYTETLIDAEHTFGITYPDIEEDITDYLDNLEIRYEVLNTSVSLIPGTNILNINVQYAELDKELSKCH